MDSNYIKIMIKFHSNLLDEYTVESLWAEVIDSEKGHYKLDNIPFYAPVACDDIVFAVFDEIEENLIYQETITYSGNSTVQIVMLDKTMETNNLRENLEKLGCKSEKFAESFFVLNIPRDLDYIPVKNYLEDLEQKGVIAYAEPCLAINHQY